METVGTTSRVMAADKPYGEFYDFYSVSPEYFGFPSYVVPMFLKSQSVEVHALSVNNEATLPTEIKVRLRFFTATESLF
jgi:hypothetical protein